MTLLRVLDCGPMTTLQDSGRIGHTRSGISRSGAMDRLALAEANALAGNPPGEGAIELLLLGGSFRAEGGPIRCAIAGAPMSAAVAGLTVPPSTSFVLLPGQTLVVAPPAIGLFAYLAVSGGIAVEPSLGSLSLQPRAGIGGIEGRPLRAGDVVPLRQALPPEGGEVVLPPTDLLPDAPIRVVLGPQDDHFSPEAIAAFLSNEYRVSPEADRMGFRLTGPPIPHLLGFNIVSDGIVSGSIQVPGSGIPILNMADHQTTGGYPKIATMLSGDMRIVAQRRAGQPVRFARVDVAEANRLAREGAATLRGLRGRVRPVAGRLPDVEALLGLNLAGDATDALAISG